MERLGLLMARGLLELGHLLPNSAESWRSPDNTCFGLVVGYYVWHGRIGRMTTQRLRSALVTGSSGGLGLAVAESLAAAGFNIILHGLEETAARATGHGGAGSAPRHRCRIRYRPASLMLRSWERICPSRTYISVASTHDTARWRATRRCRFAH